MISDELLPEPSCLASEPEPELENENDNITESDDHLPRVQIELDKLNYATEAINNLELELEESKREYVQTMQITEEQLTSLEKKLGNCVEKSKPYYDSRIELNDAKDKYLKAKNRFETAQELYVAAKNMQMYAEENLENFALNSNMDKETLTKMYEIAVVKVNDTELSKQSSDIEQIEAFKVYEETRIRVEEMEKSLKKSIEKSRVYFDLKSSLFKELRFVFTKIEGLKSCLKEAKSNYQQSLRNLETISTEIHTQRQISGVYPSDKEKSTGKSIDQTENENEIEEDFDVYFKNDLDSKVKKEIELRHFSRNNSEKLNTSLHMTDEEIENLKLDDKLKMYKENLDESNGKRKSDEIILKVKLSSSVSLPSSPMTGQGQALASSNRPQFRIPSFLNNNSK